MDIIPVAKGNDIKAPSPFSKPGLIYRIIL